MADFPRKAWGWMVAALAAGVLTLPACVTMGKFNALDERVKALEARADKLNEEVATLANRIDNLRNLTRQEEDEIRTEVANVAADVEEFQMQLGMLQGKQEELDYKMAQIAKNVKGIKGLVEDRFSTSDSDLLPKDLPAEPEPMFEAGMTAFKNALTRQARVIFNEFVKRFPQHDKTDDAVFMVGETLFAEGRYTEAIQEYKKVYEQYQTGDKYKEAVLRIGLSYVRSNQCKKAIKIYEFAATTFKDTPEGKTAADEVQKLKKACK